MSGFALLMPATKSSARPATKGDGRDYMQEIEAARATLESLQADGQAAVASDQGPTVIRNTIVDLSDAASRLRFRIPVRDYDANPIPEGRALDSEVSDFLIWLDEQYSNFRINHDARPLRRG